MDRGLGSFVGFLPLLVIAIGGAIGAHLLLSPPIEEDESDASEAGEAVLYSPSSVAAGHGLDCEEEGLNHPSPRRTVPLDNEIFCHLDDAPNKIEVLVTFDVDASGHVINVRSEGSQPMCLDREIRRSVEQWEYCPLIERGQPRSRFGQSALLIFTRMK